LLLAHITPFDAFAWGSGVLVVLTVCGFVSIYWN
jgi:hypothetical protein